MPILKEPSITLEGITVRTVTLTTLDLDVAIRVQNPNRIGVTLREIPFLVLIRERGRLEEIANGNTGTISIPARNSTQVIVPVTSHNTVILRALGAFVAKGGIEVTIKGTAVVDALITGWSVPFEKTVTVTMEQVADVVAGRKL
jgi:LEA14-like dessication related protein